MKKPTAVNLLTQYILYRLSHSVNNAIILKSSDIQTDLPIWVFAEYGNKYEKKDLMHNPDAYTARWREIKRFGNLEKLGLTVERKKVEGSKQYHWHIFRAEQEEAV